MFFVQRIRGRDAGVGRVRRVRSLHGVTVSCPYSADWRQRGVTSGWMGREVGAGEGYQSRGQVLGKDNRAQGRCWGKLREGTEQVLG